SRPGAGRAPADRRGHARARARQSGALSGARGGRRLMLDDRLARTRPEVVRAALRRRHAGAEAEMRLDAWLALDARRRALAGERDALAAQGMAASERRAVEHALAEVEREARALLLALPNVPDARVPDGSTADANVDLRRWGQPPVFAFTPRPHWELGE